MKSRKIIRRSGCPVSFTLDLLGDKWTLLIVRDMIFMGKKYYKEFLESAEGIATNILADRLKRLEEEAIINRYNDSEKQTQFIYELTDKGLDLLPVILQMIVWGAKYDPKTEAPPQFVRQVKKNLEYVSNELAENVIKKRKGSTKDS
ncbi:helix-turn-helix transcriptional regulator [bacterium]|nr:helix-turn-helix transcriptional regulator [bacterium]